MQSVEDCIFCIILPFFRPLDVSTYAFGAKENGILHHSRNPTKQTAQEHRCRMILATRDECGGIHSRSATNEMVKKATRRGLPFFAVFRAKKKGYGFFTFVQNDRLVCKLPCHCEPHRGVAIRSFIFPPFCYAGNCMIVFCCFRAYAKASFAPLLRRAGVWASSQ